MEIERHLTGCFIFSRYVRIRFQIRICPPPERLLARKVQYASLFRLYLPKRGPVSDVPDHAFFTTLRACYQAETDLDLPCAACPVSPGSTANYINTHCSISRLSNIRWAAKRQRAP